MSAQEVWDKARIEHEAGALVAGVARQTHVPVRGRMGGRMGVHALRRAGVGDDFWEYRPYTAGDGASLIDWRRTARQDTAYVRVREAQMARVVWMWCDDSGSMAWGGEKAPCPKGVRAQVLALALARLLKRDGERAEMLRQDQTGLPPPKRVGNGDAVVMLSDCFSPAEALAARLAGLGAGDGMMIQVLDEEEVLFPYEGRTLFVSPEDGESIECERAETVRATYMERLEAHNAQVARGAREARLAYMRHLTAHDPLALLVEVYTNLARSRRK